MKTHRLENESARVRYGDRNNVPRRVVSKTNHVTASRASARPRKINPQARVSREDRKCRGGRGEYERSAM